MTTPTLYTASLALDGTGSTYTLPELRELCAHWNAMGEDAPRTIRVLGNGDVIDADWNHADGDPTIIAREI